MRSSHLSLERYDSDKVANRYLERYDPHLEPFVDKAVTLLELGVYKGGSLLLWRDYFPLGKIVGIDIELPRHFSGAERIHVFEGSQADPEFLSQVASEVAPEGFDIIIDDASHIGTLSKVAFWHLFEHHLKPSGLYVVEDWGTGYWDDWHDGKSLDLQTYLPRQLHRTPFWMKSKSWLRIAKRLRPKTPMPCHSYGMVGFIKQLVDEQAAADVTRGRLRGTPQRESKFASITITPSIVFVRKANRPDKSCE
jgi:hypothetical protein